MGLRERLASAEDEARVAAAQAGNRVAEESAQGDLVELDAELAAAAAGLEVRSTAGSRRRRVVFASGDRTTTPEARARTGANSSRESYVEGGQDQDGSIASRRSVDELFARIRASRAAEEAAAGVTAPLSLPPGSGQAAELAEEALTVPEAAGLMSQVSPEAGEANHSARSGGGDVEEIAGTVDVAAGPEITEAAETAPEAETASEAEAAAGAAAIAEPIRVVGHRRDGLLGPHGQARPGAEASAPRRPERPPERLAPSLPQTPCWKC